MTKKEKTIEAVYELINMYKEGNYSPFLCPLCDIHKKKFSFYMNCKGCPNFKYNAVDWQYACGAMDYDTYVYKGLDNEYRIKFWEKALPILKKTPSIEFTRRESNFPYYKLILIGESIKLERQRRIRNEKRILL